MYTATIDTRAELGRVAVAVCGEIDMTVQDDLSLALKAAAMTAEGGLVVVDLSKVSFIDSSGTAALMDGWRAALDCGGAYRVVGACGVVAKVLKVTGVFEVLTSGRDAPGSDTEPPRI